MFYVMMDEKSVATYDDINAAETACRELMAREPIPSEWWIADADGDEVCHMGMTRGIFG